MAQELISPKVLSLDFWQDATAYAGSVMPTGTIGCAVLNIPDETIARLDAPCMILNQLLTGIGEKNVDKLAERNTIKSNVFAKTAIRYIQSMPEVRMLRSAVVPLESETLGK